jgi:hypothetical protein
MASKKFLAGIVTFFCAAASAQAGQIPLSTSFGVGTTLTEGKSLNLQVDVNSLLAKSGFSSQSIISGMLTVSGFSAPDYVDNESKSSTSSKSGNVITHIDAFTSNHLDLVADTMTVSAGDASESDTAAVIADSTNWGDLIFDRTNDNGKGTINKYYHRNNDHFFSISGGLEVLLDLDAKALLDLAEDGVLDLSISSFKGKFNVTNVNLDFTAEQSDTPAQSDIPLPTSQLLTGLGLAALGVTRRRQA